MNALLDTTGGLHPEFSGYENVRAALESMGYEDDSIADATRDIAEFTELGRFLDQPFKTYSLGMQSRLAFAVATAVDPEILVVDEMLGAGDAYFFAKALERMEALISGGAAVLIVSHALDQIIRFCDEAIWLDRGRMVMRAESTEVVRAYERFTRELEDRRLRARNRKVLAGYDAFEREGHTDQLDVALTPEGGPVEVTGVRLLRDGDVEEQLRVGDAQDADESQSAFVDLSAGGWSREEHGDAGYLRRVAPPDTGHALFALWFFYPTSRYELEVTYRAPGGPVRLRVERAGRAEAERELPAAPDWRTETLSFGAAGAVRATDDDTAPGQPVRWPGEGSLRIEDLTLHGDGGREQAVFPVGTPLTIRLTVRAVEAGRYPVTPAVSVYRTDGILVSNHPGEEAEVALAEGEEATWQLAFGPLNLGDGRYVLTPGDLPAAHAPRRLAVLRPARPLRTPSRSSATRPSRSGSSSIRPGGGRFPRPTIPLRPRRPSPKSARERAALRPARLRHEPATRGQRPAAHRGALPALSAPRARLRRGR